MKAPPPSRVLLVLARRVAFLLPSSTVVVDLCLLIGSGRLLEGFEQMCMIVCNRQCNAREKLWTFFCRSQLKVGDVIDAVSPSSSFLCFFFIGFAPRYWCRC